MPFGHLHAQQVARTPAREVRRHRGSVHHAVRRRRSCSACPSGAGRRSRPRPSRSRASCPGWPSATPTPRSRASDQFPVENRPPLWITFVSLPQHGAARGLVHRPSWPGRPGSSTAASCARTGAPLRALLCSIPLPMVACQLGWVAAEVGRQPWIVYGPAPHRPGRAPRTRRPPPEIVFSLGLFGLVYLGLLRPLAHPHGQQGQGRRRPPTACQGRPPWISTPSGSCSSASSSPATPSSTASTWASAPSPFRPRRRGERPHLDAIGPVWDGNEVWLLTGGGALFAAFPVVYATVFSGFYLALMLLLLALIGRAVSLEFRAQGDRPAGAGRSGTSPSGSEACSRPSSSAWRWGTSCAACPSTRPGMLGRAASSAS